jgi:hypothetical protein
MHFREALYATRMADKAVDQATFGQRQGLVFSMKLIQQLSRSFTTASRCMLAFECLYALPHHALA